MKRMSKFEARVILTNVLSEFWARLSSDYRHKKSSQYFNNHINKTNFLSGKRSWAYASRRKVTPEWFFATARRPPQKLLHSGYCKNIAQLRWYKVAKEIRNFFMRLSGGTYLWALRKLSPEEVKEIMGNVLNTKAPKGKNPYVAHCEREGADQRSRRCPTRVSAAWVVIP